MMIFDNAYLLSILVDLLLLSDDCDQLRSNCLAKHSACNSKAVLCKHRSVEGNEDFCAATELLLAWVHERGLA